jgi:hypothetical protein
MAVSILNEIFNESDDIFFNGSNTVISAKYRDFNIVKIKVHQGLNEFVTYEVLSNNHDMPKAYKEYQNEFVNDMGFDDSVTWYCFKDADIMQADIDATFETCNQLDLVLHCMEF